MTMISTVVDGLTRENCRFEASVADENLGLFRPDEAAEMLKTAGVLLYMRLVTFLWWFEGFTRLEIGDWMREKESLERGERGSDVLLRCERYHGTPVQLKVVNRWIADELILQL